MAGESVCRRSCPREQASPFSPEPAVLPAAAPVLAPVLAAVLAAAKTKADAARGHNSSRSGGRHSTSVSTGPAGSKR